MNDLDLKIYLNTDICSSIAEHASAIEKAIETSMKLSDMNLNDASYKVYIFGQRMSNDIPHIEYENQGDLKSLIEGAENKLKTVNDNKYGILSDKIVVDVFVDIDGNQYIVPRTFWEGYAKK